MLFLDLVNQDFSNKNNTTTKNKIGQQGSKKSTLLKQVKNKKWFSQIKKHANLLRKL